MEQAKPRRETQKQKIARLELRIVQYEVTKIMADLHFKQLEVAVMILRGILSDVEANRPHCVDWTVAALIGSFLQQIGEI